MNYVPQLLNHTIRKYSTARKYGPIRLPRKRFGRKITARFSGNATVDRKPHPNGPNY